MVWNFSILRILKEYYNKDNIFLQSNTMYGVRTIAITSGLICWDMLIVP